MTNKEKEHIEQLYIVVKSQNKYIESLETALKVKPKVVTKYIESTDELYRVNSVKLFKQYTKEIEELEKQNKTLHDEVASLARGYIKAEGEYSA